MSDRLATRDRLAVLDRLAGIIGEVSGMASWLADSGEDAAALQAEDAARNLMAAAWLLRVPIGERAPGMRGQAVAEALAHAKRAG